VLQCWQEKTARDLVEVLISDVARFAHRAEQSDDITCLAVQFRPST
jgi:serine phosphatase RsbU (regulator of sigma subunit)